MHNSGSAHITNRALTGHSIVSGCIWQTQLLGGLIQKRTRSTTPTTAEQALLNFSRAATYCFIKDVIAPQALVEVSIDDIVTNHHALPGSSVQNHVA